MNARQRRTLEAIFETPTRTDIRWAEVEALFRALGAKMVQGSGSRIRVEIAGVHAVFHAPHPGPSMKEYCVRDVRDLLLEAGVTP